MRRSWVVLLVLSGCLVTEGEYESMKGERDKFRSRVSELEEELDQAKGKIVEVQKQLETAQETKPTRPPDAQVASAYAELKLVKGDQLIARLETSEGPIRCELYPHIAPTAVLNFVGLAEGTKEWTEPKSGQRTMQPLYAGTKFHRVVPGFMIMGGDPIGTGRGGPGYTFGEEIWPDVRFDRPGLLAMTSSGTNTSGSQFFITASAQPHLNGLHTIFGTCDTETVEKILAVPVGGPDGTTPTKDVVISQVVVERKQKTAAN